MPYENKNDAEKPNDQLSRYPVIERRNVLKTAGSIIAAGTVGLAGCTGITDESSGDGNNEMMTIGIMIPMTGKYSSYGSLYRAGFKTWEKVVNEQGGSNGHKIKLRFEDNQSSETRTSKIASQFAADNVAFMIQSYSSPLTRAAAPIAEQNQIPLFSTGSLNPKMYAKYNYVFEFEPPPIQEAAAAVLSKMTPIKKVAVWGSDQSFAKVAMSGFINKAAPKHNLNVVYSTFHSSNIQDFTPFILKAKNRGAQALVTFNYPRDVIGQTRAINTSSWNPKFISELTATSPTIYDALGPKVTQGIAAPSLWSTRVSIEGNETFKQTFREVAPKTISLDYHCALAYASLQPFGAAVKALDDDAADGAKLRDWYANNAVQTILGTSKFDKRGVQVGFGWKEAQWHGNKTPFIYPPSVKAAELIYPKPWP
jgi:ABC-type branched-subunit amino acid transport system substrate-binding protein